MSLVSVIMPTFNKAQYLELTLTGFTLQTYTDFEIILVDDGSTDHTRQVAESFSANMNVKYIYQDNAGRSNARNRALDKANGEILVFNDDDRIPVPEFLQAHVDRLGTGEKLLSVGNKSEIITFISEKLD